MERKERETQNEIRLKMVIEMKAGKEENRHENRLQSLLSCERKCCPWCCHWCCQWWCPSCLLLWYHMIVDIVSFSYSYSQMLRKVVPTLLSVTIDVTSSKLTTNDRLNVHYSSWGEKKWEKEEKKVKWKLWLFFLISRFFFFLFSIKALILKKNCC